MAVDLLTALGVPTLLVLLPNALPPLLVLFSDRVLDDLEPFTATEEEASLFLLRLDMGFLSAAEEPPLLLLNNLRLSMGAT